MYTGVTCVNANSLPLVSGLFISKNVSKYYKLSTYLSRHKEPLHHVHYVTCWLSRVRRQGAEPLRNNTIKYHPTNILSLKTNVNGNHNVFKVFCPNWNYSNYKAKIETCIASLWSQKRNINMQPHTHRFDIYAPNVQLFCYLNLLCFMYGPN